MCYMLMVWKNIIINLDNGSILNKDICALNPEDIMTKFHSGVKFLTAASLEAGYIYNIK